jgi:hypothetical protein
MPAVKISSVKKWKKTTTQNRTKAACRSFENAHCATLFRRLVCAQNNQTQNMCDE